MQGEETKTPKSIDIFGIIDADIAAIVASNLPLGIVEFLKNHCDSVKQAIERYLTDYKEYIAKKPTDSEGNPVVELTEQEIFERLLPQYKVGAEIDLNLFNEIAKTELINFRSENFNYKHAVKFHDALKETDPEFFEKALKGEINATINLANETLYPIANPLQLKLQFPTMISDEAMVEVNRLVVVLKQCIAKYLFDNCKKFHGFIGGMERTNTIEFRRLMGIFDLNDFKEFKEQTEKVISMSDDITDFTTNIAIGDIWQPLVGQNELSIQYQMTCKIDGFERKYHDDLSLNYFLTQRKYMLFSSGGDEEAARKKLDNF